MHQMSLSAALTCDCTPLFRTQHLHADKHVSAQAGAEGLLTVRDETGSTPAQLAVSKGHRPLGVYLADWRRRVPCWIAMPCQQPTVQQSIAGSTRLRGSAAMRWLVTEMVFLAQTVTSCCRNRVDRLCCAHGACCNLCLSLAPAAYQRRF